MEEQSRGFPKGLEYEIALDTTEFVHESINEVVKTLLEVVVLVIVVVYIFLQSSFGESSGFVPTYAHAAFIRASMVPEPASP